MSRRGQDCGGEGGGESGDSVEGGRGGDVIMMGSLRFEGGCWNVGERWGGGCEVGLRNMRDYW